MIKGGAERETSDIGKARQIEGGFRYPLYSMLNNPALQNAHSLALSFSVQNNDELATVRQLSSLTIPNREGRMSLDNRFASMSDNGPNFSVPDSKQLTATEGLLVYTSAKLENLLRLQGVRAPEGTDNGISLMFSRELAQLSNIYRCRSGIEPDKKYFIDIAHSLAMYALRFKVPDHHGYSQTLAHWLHLEVDVELRNLDMFDKYEELLKLALALEEIGYGPQESYVKFIVRDLLKLHKIKGEGDKAQELEMHFRNIPSIKGEIEHAWQKEYDLRRKKAMGAKIVTNKASRQRKKRHR